MKNITLLTWLTQLGLSVAVPILGFVFLGVWLQRQFSLGTWVVVIATLLGVMIAADGVRRVLKQLDRIAGGKKKDPPVSFNEHE